MMKKLFLFAGLTLVSGAGQSALSQALDPTFAPAGIYAPGDVHSVQQQADGKLVVSGTISRVNGNAMGSLVRLNPNGTVDAAFQQNVGTALTAPGAQLLPNGQLLAVAYFGQGNPLTAGGITRNGLLRLNANGTADATFDAGTGPAGFIDRVLPLPNGQFLVVGSFGAFNGAPGSGIVRLNASGTVDPTFNTAGAGSNIEIEGIAALPSGKFLINGYFTTYNRNACNGLARLNADGSFDPTFKAALQTDEEAAQIAVQPDGRILVAGGIYDDLLRLMPDGSVDPSFAYSTANPFPNYLYSNFASPFALQPDGKILLASGPAPSGTPPLPRVLRLNPNGTVDQTFQIGTGPNNQVRTVLLLAGGGVLVGGNFTNFNGTADRQLVRLSSSGAVDLTFQPALQSNGSVAAVVRQADGKLVIRGNFCEVNGQPASSLARINANGTLDTSFTSPYGYFTSVVDLALQPDGRILAATNNTVQRLLTSGSPDNSFTSPNLVGSALTRLLLQADGRLLVGARRLRVNNVANAQGLVRLLPTGTLDNTFVPNTTGAGLLTGVQSLAQQPNGKLLVGGQAILTGTTAVGSVLRLETTGATDASFMSNSFGDGQVNSLGVQPDGKVVVGGRFLDYGGTARRNVARLNADGTLDTGFVPPVIDGTVNAVLLQPNNRLLLGGAFTSASLPTNLARLLATGAADVSFGATAVPNAAVNALLVQPDGAIVLGGSFSTVGGQSANALARITASNVLAVAAPGAVATRTEAWPVPAQGHLNVAFAPSAHAQDVELLDLLGRPVQRQHVAGNSTATIPLEGVAAGPYLLRVTYAEGAVTRRVQVQ